MCCRTSFAKAWGENAELAVLICTGSTIQTKRDNHNLPNRLRCCLNIKGSFYQKPRDVTTQL